MKRLSLLATLVVLASLVAVATALASHSASGSDKAQFSRALKTSNLTPPPIHAGHFRLAGATVSDAGPWAEANVIPTGSAKSLGSVQAIFRRAGGGWRLAALGTDDVGCANPRLPAAVRRDLGIDC